MTFRPKKSPKTHDERLEEASRVMEAYGLTTGSAIPATTSWGGAIGPATVPLTDTLITYVKSWIDAYPHLKVIQEKVIGFYKDHQETYIIAAWSRGSTGAALALIDADLREAFPDYADYATPPAKPKEPAVPDWVAFCKNR